jgi:release factor glutamine methyltransferase
VHRPRSDTWLLADALRGEPLAGRSVADLCTGSGALAITAARQGAARVLAVDVSRRAVMAATINARLNGCSLHARRGDLFTAMRGERFDLIVCNPPYVPARTDALPRHRSTTPLDGGRDGRAILDRVCRGASRGLREGGTLLLVHSSVSGVQLTRRLLFDEGFETEIVRRVLGPLGATLRARAPMLRERGLLGDRDEEELVVIRARAPSVRDGVRHGSPAIAAPG